jgi:hypothetical protein
LQPWRNNVARVVYCRPEASPPGRSLSVRGVPSGNAT